MRSTNYLNLYSTAKLKSRYTFTSVHFVLHINQCSLNKIINGLRFGNISYVLMFKYLQDSKSLFLQLLFTLQEKLKQEFYTFWIHTCKVIRSITCFSLYPSFICGSGIWQHVFVLQSSYHYYAYLNTFIFLFGYKWFFVFLLSPRFVDGHCFYIRQTNF